MTTSVSKVIENASTSATLANTKSAARGHNADGSKLNVLASMAREGAAMYANGGALRERGLSNTTAALMIAYQDDDYARAQIDRYLHTRGKDAEKQSKETMDAWFSDFFDITKPDMKRVRPLARYGYQNRINALNTSMKRVVTCFKLGLRFRMNEKKETFVTLDTYRAVTKDLEAKEDVQVSDKAHATSTMTAWSALSATDKKKDKVKSGGTLTITAANFGIICASIKQTAEEVEPTKMDGKTRQQALEAFFALSILLGAKEDKALIAEYDSVTKALSA